MCVLCDRRVVTFVQLDKPWAPRYIVMHTTSGWTSYDEYVVCGSCQVSVWRDSGKSVDLDNKHDCGVECQKPFESLAEWVDRKLHAHGHAWWIDKIEFSKRHFIVEEEEDAMSIDGDL